MHARNEMMAVAPKATFKTHHVAPHAAMFDERARLARVRERELWDRPKMTSAKMPSPLSAFHAILLILSADFTYVLSLCSAAASLKRRTLSYETTNRRDKKTAPPPPLSPSLSNPVS